MGTWFSSTASNPEDMEAVMKLTTSAAVVVFSKTYCPYVSARCASATAPVAEARWRGRCKRS
jgi:L-cysteine desulfidase